MNIESILVPQRTFGSLRASSKKRAIELAAEKIAKNMEILQEFDLKSKGYGNSSSTPSDLMKELVFKLVNP